MFKYTDSFYDAYRQAIGLTAVSDAENVILEQFGGLLNQFVTESFSKLPRGLDVTSLTAFVTQETEEGPEEEESLLPMEAYTKVLGSDVSEADLTAAVSESDEDEDETITSPEQFFEAYYAEMEAPVTETAKRRWEVREATVEPDEMSPDAAFRISEAEKFLGISKTVPDQQEIQDYFNRIMSGDKTAKDKYVMPYVHKKLLIQIDGPSVVMNADQTKAVEVSDSDSKPVDLDLLKKTLTERPKRVLSQNEKMMKSGGSDYAFFNFGIPALRGLAVDEETNKFVVVNTCPGAGSCKLVCYALKGGYVQYPLVFVKQTKLLNYLLNDPDGFFEQVSSEISVEEVKYKKKNATLVVRWHDAGDFFSGEYLQAFFGMVREHPAVMFYAYTKLSSVALGDKPDNFMVNFSQGALKSQENQVDVTAQKNSVIVPKDNFKGLLAHLEDKEAKPDNKGNFPKYWDYKDDEAKATFKTTIADMYDLDVSSVLTYDEMVETPISSTPNKYNVIVLPGEGDWSAARPDVLGTYLFIH